MLRNPAVLFILFFVMCCTLTAAADDAQKKWEPYYFGPATEGGLVSENEEGVRLSLDRVGLFGIYNPSKFGGNFDVQARSSLRRDRAA
jgi:hypothetical protein